MPRGAGIIHNLLRDADHRPTLDLPLLKEWVAAVRESSSLVVQLSTGGSVHDPLEARLKVLDAEPDSCSLTMGTTNFGDDVFMNPWPFVCELYQLSQERRVVPEFELFDLGQAHALQRLLDKHGLPHGGKVHCDLVMGVPGGINGTADALVASVAALPAEVTSWSATGIGRSTLPVALAALSEGGHLRLGMEGGSPSAAACLWSRSRSSCTSGGARADGPARLHVSGRSGSIAGDVRLTWHR